MALAPSERASERASETRSRPEIAYARAFRARPRRLGVYSCPEMKINAKRGSGRVTAITRSPNADRRIQIRPGSRCLPPRPSYRGALSLTRTSPRYHLHARRLRVVSLRRSRSRSRRPRRFGAEKTGGEGGRSSEIATDDPSWLTSAGYFNINLRWRQARSSANYAS